MLPKQLALDINILSSPEIKKAFDKLIKYLDEANYEASRNARGEELIRLSGKAELLKEIKNIPDYINDTLNGTRDG